MHGKSEINPGRRAFITGRWQSRSGIHKTCLDYSGVYCQSCKEVCEAQAIVFKQPQYGMAVPELVLEKCTGCMDCVETCPVNAITINKNDPRHHA